MQSEINRCINCKHIFIDDRLSAYRREKFYFCRKKGAFFSRNYKIGEGTRVSKDDIGCANFIIKR